MPNWQTSLSIIALVLGLLGLFLAWLPVWRHWQYRRRAWLENPERLLDPPPRPPVNVAGTLICGLLVTGLGALLVAEPLLPPALFLASLGCFTVMHQTTWPSAGYLGMVLISLMLISAGAAYLVPSPTGGLLGASVAGVWMLWASRFWYQQLLENRPWTTTGRLIPLCRTMGRSLAALTLVIVVGLWLLAHQPMPNLSREVVFGGRWLVGLVLATLVLLSLMLVRDGADQRRAASGFAACLAGGAAAGVFPMLFDWGQRPLLPLGILAGGGVTLIIAARARLAQVSGFQAIAYNVLLTLAAVVMLIIVLLRPAGLGEITLNAWVGVGIAFAALVLWWWPTKAGGVRTQREWT